MGSVGDAAEDAFASDGVAGAVEEFPHGRGVRLGEGGRLFHRELVFGNLFVRNPRSSGPLRSYLHTIADCHR